MAWLNFGPTPSIAFAMVSVTTVLIIACPCALGLATSMSVMVGVGKAAQAGVLIRNGEALQTASKITNMVWDKTGTIAKGEPKVTDVYGVNKQTPEEMLILAASIEAGSEHPLAIVDSAKEQGIDPRSISDFMSTAGQGVQATLDNSSLLFGSEPW